MRKALVLPLCLIFCLLFCACKAPTVSHTPELTKFFECEFEAKTPLESYTCRFVRSPEKSEITVIKPETIEGLMFKYESGAYSAEYDGVSLSSDENETTRYFAKDLISALEEIFSYENIVFREENGLYVYDANGKTKVSFDKNGFLCKAELLSLDTTVNVKSFGAKE